MIKKGHIQCTGEAFSNWENKKIIKFGENETLNDCSHILGE